MEEKHTMQIVPSLQSGVPEWLMHKNCLQEYAGRMGHQLPFYHSVNEGFTHAPRFRASVVVDGVKYISPRTFHLQKEAEQDVVSIAFESILKRIRNEAYSFIHKDTKFCKLIVHEFAVKMNMNKPT